MGYCFSDDGVSADAMPASESVMVYSSSQSVSSTESGNDSVNSVSISYHKDHVQILYDKNNTIFGHNVQVHAYS